ncbi:MAG: hypothetical protein ACYCW6_03120, partial [Candidatus Xenobia bacterium]
SVEETVGNTVSSLYQTPRALAHAYKAIWNTKQIGPVLKGTLMLALPIALPAGPALTAIGSAGFGLFRGFEKDAVEKKGFVEAVKTGAKDVKTFNTDLAGKLVDGLHEFETEPLPPGKKPYDIKVVEAGKGLAAGVVGAAVDGPAIGVITTARVPKGFYKAMKEIWSKDNNIGPVLKSCATILAVPAAVLAVPFSFVGGAVYGFATGLHDGYSKNFTEGVKTIGHNVSQYNDATREMLKD